MAITRRTLASAAVTSTTTNPTSLSGSPTGMQASDLLIAIHGSAGGAATHTAPVGWTQMGAASQVTTCAVAVWAKDCTGGEAGPYAFSVGGTGRRQCLYFVCLTDAKLSASQPDKAATTDSGTGRSAVTMAAQTLDFTTDYVLVAGVSVVPALSTDTLSGTAGLTELADQIDTHASSSHCNQAVYELFPGSTALGAKTVTRDTSPAGGMVGVMVAFEPYLVSAKLGPSTSEVVPHMGIHFTRGVLLDPISIASSSGGAAVPTSGQIFPRGRG